MSKYQYRPPCRELSGYVQYYWMLDLEDVCPSCEPHRLTPQGFMEIVFYYRDLYKLILSDGEESHPRATLYGQRTEFIDILPTGRVGLMSVVFTPVGIRDILHLPLNELTNRYVSLEEALGKEGKDMEEQMMNLASFDERVDGLETFLLGRLQRRNEFENNRMRMVMTRLLQCRGMFNVEQLAGYACLSKKQFERVFSTYVGLMPKQYLRVIRFLYAVEFRNRMPEVDLATLAFHTGYYDAAHLANEIKALTGHTSSTLFQLMCFSEDVESIEWFLGA